MIRHVVMFRWRDGVADGAVAALQAGLARLPDAIPEIVSYDFGPDLGLGEGQYHFAVVADFADEAGYRAYARHPTHLALIRDLVTPIAADVVRVQFRV